MPRFVEKTRRPRISYTAIRKGDVIGRVTSIVAVALNGLGNMASPKDDGWLGLLGRSIPPDDVV